MVDNKNKEQKVDNKKEEVQEVKEEYEVVEVPQSMMKAIEYPDGKVYTFEAVIFDVLKRVAQLEKKIG